MSHSSDAFRLFSAARARTQRARKFSKIRELAEAVKSAGFLALDEQAKALGLPRSTAWTIRRATHKASGLSPRRSCQRLPEPRSSNTSRKKLPDYTETAGVDSVSSPPGFQPSTMGSPVRETAGHRRRAHFGTRS
jgi:hypothetical protein